LPILAVLANHVTSATRFRPIFGLEVGETFGTVRHE
jgi:hypothetical protein